MGTVAPWVHFAHKWYIQMFGHFAAAGSLAEEVLGSIRTVKAFGSEKQLGARFGEMIEQARLLGKKLAMMETTALPILCRFRMVEEADDQIACHGWCTPARSSTVRHQTSSKLSLANPLS